MIWCAKYVGIGIMLGVLLIGIIISGPTSTNKIYQSSDDVDSSQNNINDTDACSSKVCQETVTEIILSLNTSVDPCEDFYYYACQGWQSNNPLAEQITGHTKLEKFTNHIVADILQAPLNGKETTAFVKAKQFFQGCMNIGARKKTEKQLEKLEEEYMQFMWEILEEFGGLSIYDEFHERTWHPNRISLEQSLAGIHKMFDVPLLLDVSSLQQQQTNGSNRTEQWLVLSPPPSYSFHISENNKNELLDDDLNFVISMMQKVLKFRIGIRGLKISWFNSTKKYVDLYLRKKAQQIFAVQYEIQHLESWIGSKALAQIESLKEYVDIVFTARSLGSLQHMLDYVAHDICPRDAIDLTKWLKTLYEDTGVEITDSTWIDVENIDYLLKLSIYLCKKSEDTVLNYIHWRMVQETIGVLTTTEDVSKLNGDDKEVGPRQVACAEWTLQIFHKAITVPYVERLGFNDYDQVQQMFQNLKTELDTVVEMTSSAKLVLESIQLCNEYPSWFNDSYLIDKKYGDLNLNGLPFLRQAVVATEWSVKKKLEMPPFSPNIVKSCEWDEFAGSLGAWYDQNFVYVSLGYLQTPYFDKGLPRAMLYGYLGNMLAHEVSHGIFGQVIIDKEDEGILNTYSLKFECLIDRYDSFKITKLATKNLYVNGELTLEENFSDNQGLFLAYKAYKKAKVDMIKKPTQLKNFTDDQLFFLAFAQSFCSVISPTHLRAQLEKGPHSPHHYRILGTLQNSEEFAEAWDCPLGSIMNPHEKCA